MGNKFGVVVDDGFETKFELFLLVLPQKCALETKTLNPLLFETRIPDSLLQALTSYSKWL